MSIVTRGGRALREQSVDRDLFYLQVVPEEVGKGVIVQKNGAFLGAVEVSLRSYECSPPADLTLQAQMLRQALGAFPEGCEVQIEVKRGTPPDPRVPRSGSESLAAKALADARKELTLRLLRDQEFWESEATVYLTWEPDRRNPGKTGFLERLLRPPLRGRDFREAEHRRSLKTFLGHLDAVTRALDGARLGARILDGRELVARIRTALDPRGSGRTSEIKPWQYVSELVAPSVTVRWDHVLLGSRGRPLHAAVLSATSPTDGTRPYCLRQLLRFRFPCRLVLGIDMTRQSQELERQKSLLDWTLPHIRRVSFGSGELAPDKNAETKAAAHEGVIDRMLKEASKLWPTAVQIVVYAESGDELERRVRQVQAEWTQAMPNADLLREELGAWPNLCATLPGMLSYSARRIRYESPNVAHMAVGCFAGRASRGYLGRTTLVDREGAPVPFSLFGGDLETLGRVFVILGQKGGGKSVLMSNLVANELAVDDIVVCGVDVGGSSALLSELFGGVTQRLSLYSEKETDVPNPCEHDVFDDDALEFMLEFLDLCVSDEHERGMDLEERGIVTLILKELFQGNPIPGALVLGDIEKALKSYRGAPSIQDRMGRIGGRLTYITQGPLGRILNRRSAKSLVGARFLYWDFQDLGDKDQARRILMHAVLHRVLTLAHRVGKSTKKVLYWDEFEHLTKDRPGRRMAAMGGRRSRKLNMAFLAATQSFGDVNAPDMRDSVTNNADMVFLMPSPNEDYRALAETFGLNAREVEMLREIRTKPGHYSETFCIAPQGSPLRGALRLHNQRELLWINTTRPDDVVMREAAFADPRFGGDLWKAIRHLAEAHPHGAPAPGGRATAESLGVLA